MSERNRFARIMLVVLPAVLIFGYLNVGMGWVPANLEDQEYFGETVSLYDKDILVGAYYFPGGFHSANQTYFDDVRSTDPADNSLKVHWTGVHIADQDYYDSHGFTLESGDQTYSHDFIRQDWQLKYLFDADQATFPTGWNYWDSAKNAARFKQAYGHLANWSDNDHHMRLPLSSADGYLGYYDHDDDDVWEEQIEAAAAHGVDFFAYEIFWNYDADDSTEKSSMREPIDNGFMNALNKNDMRYAFCWLNHDWIIGDQNYSNTALLKFVDFLHREYIGSSTNYLKIDGKPVVYVYNIDKQAGGL